jgi:iron complex transport system ATP-binding protein
MNPSSAAACAQPDPLADQPPALDFAGVSVVVDGAPRPLVRDVDWRVLPGEHWAVLGTNGAGKTTLLQVATGALEPTSGTLTVMGDRLGAAGLSDPRLRIATLKSRPGTFPHGITALQVVLMREAGPFALLGSRITSDETQRARDLLALFGCAELEDARYRGCSEGERQRVLLARALMRDPSLMLFDEPIAALDLPGREALLQALVRLAGERPRLATVTVTHHVEELPPTTSHALLMRDGAVMAAGPVDDVLTEERLSDCLGMPVSLLRADGRWTARAR